ncbi:hypothetical protein H0H93_009652 [Arthromyces matolae]|nr:hypothetical protein H0H93_009652 [Arthromyces matolae]
MPFDPAERAAQISTQVREALRKALPAPAEQFFTVMVPGKVVNLSEYAEGFDDKGNLTNPILPIETERKQAVLCDDMPALAPVQLGPTGKSVARSYSAAISKLIPTASEVPAPPVVTVDTTQLKTLTADFITKRNQWQQALGDNKKTQDQRDAAATAYQTALDALKKEQAKHDASTVQGSIDANQTAKSKLYAELVGAQGWAVKAVARNNDTIKEYEAEIAKLGVKGGGDPHDAYVDELATSANIPESQKDPAAAANPDEDYFTSIQLRIASKSSKETKSASSSKASFGASIGWGWWKVEANAQSSESSAAMSKAMSDNEVTIKFECMRVDIQRSWLRGELFYDSDLDAAQGDAISPGFSRLKELMEGGKAGDEKELQRYSQFPFYPTAFLLATNVTLEIKGETSEIQSRFSQSSSSGDAGFNYGPFISVGGSASKSSESSDSSCTATSDGCRISTGNILIMRGNITIEPPSRTTVSYEFLSQLVAEYLLTHSPNVDISDALSIMPHTQKGLDLNPVFTSPTSFQPATKTAGGELKLFSQVGIDLVHGWLVDPDSPEARAMTEENTEDYDSAVALIAEADHIAGGLLVPMDGDVVAAPKRREQDWTDAEHKKINNAITIRQFLESSQSQLTYHGLFHLVSTLQPGSLVALFRSSHLSVLYKSGDDWQVLNDTSEINNQAPSSTPPTVQPDEPPSPILAASLTPDNVPTPLELPDAPIGAPKSYDEEGQIQIPVPSTANEPSPEPEPEPPVTKNTEDSILYSLATDQVFLYEPSVVWERIEDVDGSAGVFVDSSFVQATPVGGDWAGRTADDIHRAQEEAIRVAQAGQDGSLSDAELARQLQAEEEHYARRQQEAYNQQRRQEEERRQKELQIRADKEREKVEKARKKKNKDCVIM